jgi:uncharacterized SAM-binding protein YcdF (DUF218 family)
VQKIYSWLSHHHRRLLLAGLALLLLYFVLPVALTKLAGLLIRDDRARLPANVDLIVSLGGSFHCERELVAAELFKQGRGTYVTVSGVPAGKYGHTADSLQRTLIAAGLPAERVLAMRDNFNTRTEAKNVAQIMRQRGWRRAIIVTSAFHSRRALYTMESAARDLEFYSAPVPIEGREWSPARWWSRRRDSYLTVRECLSWINTGLRGWE